MATTTSKTRPMSLDLNSAFENAASQFRGLNPNQPGQWPLLPKLATWLALAAVMVVLGWFLVLSASHEALEGERGKEPGLKADYRSKLTQAVNLPELRKQKLQVQEYVTQLEKQLPGRAEMDALLSDINQAGLGRGLQFELFKPGQVEVKEYYAELPISLKVSGKYHDIGSFAADVANLSRIVTLHNVTIVAPPRDPNAPLMMDAVARTYRYLDQAEIEARRAATAQAAKAAGAPK
jgi:type IV pilus assembly protein PilO